MNDKNSDNEKPNIHDKIDQWIADSTPWLRKVEGFACGFALAPITIMNDVVPARHINETYFFRGKLAGAIFYIALAATYFNIFNDKLNNGEFYSENFYNEDYTYSGSNTSPSVEVVNHAKNFEYTRSHFNIISQIETIDAPQSEALEKIPQNKTPDNFPINEHYKLLERAL